MKKDFKIIALVICFFCIGFVMLLLVARWRIYTGWSMVIEDALSNERLKNEIGNVLVTIRASFVNSRLFGLIVLQREFSPTL